MREIKVKKSDLIDKIKKNKQNHVKLYEKAIIAYKREALKQLTELTSKIESGEMDIALDLVKPQNNSEKYDEAIEQFEWELEDEVTLSQNEFQQYIQDKTSFSQQALFTNSLYMSNLD